MATQCEMSDSAIINVKDVDFFREDRRIFEQISLSIPAGKITAIMGPSGTGKTTLLHLMAGLLAPAQGQITILGHNIADLSRHTLFKLREEMGMLFQSGALFTSMTVYDNIAFPLREHTKLPEKLIRDVVLMKLEAVGLRGARDLMPNALSGGMARRVALARAIALDPKILFYDEPFTGQDPISMGALIKLIKTLNDSLGMTSVIVSHDVQEALDIADYVIILEGGRIACAGTPSEIRNHQHDLVHQFIHGEPDGPVAFDYPAVTPRQDFIEVLH